jgi:hypothetical protein
LDPVDDNLEEESVAEVAVNLGSEGYRSNHVQVIDGLEFEKVGDEWLPVTTKVRPTE